MRRVIIIGSGPAGYTAAIYSARAGLAPLVLTGERIGGWLTTTTEIENFPGFPDGVLGSELMEQMKRQAERFGAEISIDTVTKVDLSKRPFQVFINDRIETAESIIIATGSSARRLNVPGEDRLWGHGLSICATCDGFFFRDKDIAVVGGGDSAMEEAIFLTRFARQVQILVRGSEHELRASKPMLERARANEKIEFIYNVDVVEVLGEQIVRGVTIKNNQTNEERELALAGLFLAIGQVPNTQLFTGQLELSKGYIVTDCKSTATKVPGVFACGDVADWKFRQAITAAGTGCMAALEAQRFLAEKI
ncbi:thioredoxin-disulfide reductase [Patescibacteria group bacterium]|nr:thioredoxin-disulfide reductase [Patescibacteria group bacterium]MBU1029565.1 thioredoxin-disulfide reductase [Patescibacteria group bacterium]